MSARIINVGIIGVGRIGKLHAENLAYRIPDARIVAIADIQKDAAEQVATRLGVSKASGDYHTILVDKDIDAILICSATDTHAQIIEEASAVGKHIFCEKPIDLDLKRIDQALAAAKKAGVKLLFDGKTTEGWRSYKKDRISPGWKVIEGALVRAEGGAGDIVTKDQYDAFELLLDYRISPGGNSGLMFHVTEEGDTPWMTGPEVQIQDN